MGDVIDGAQPVVPPYPVGNPGPVQNCGLLGGELAVIHLRLLPDLARGADHPKERFIGKLRVAVFGIMGRAPENERMTGRLSGHIAEGFQHANNLVRKAVGAESFAAAVAVPAAAVVGQVIPQRRNAIAAQFQEASELLGALAHGAVIGGAEVSHAHAAYDANSALVRLGEESPEDRL